MFCLFVCRSMRQQEYLGLHSNEQICMTLLPGVSRAKEQSIKFSGIIRILIQMAWWKFALSD